MRLFPLLLLLLLPLFSMANDNSLTPALYKTLNEIQDQLGEKEYEQVAARLIKLEEDLKPSFGLALVYQLHGQLWLLQEKPEKGLEFFNKALELDVLAPAQEIGIATTAAQILLSLDRPDDAYNDLEPRLKRILAQEKEDNAKPRQGRRYKNSEDAGGGICSLSARFSWHNTRLACIPDASAHRNACREFCVNSPANSGISVYSSLKYCS